MSLYHKNKKIERVGFVGYGLSNSALYEHLKSEYPSLSFSFRLLREKRQDFMKKCYTGADLYRDIDEDVLFFSPSVKRPSLKKDVIFSSECEYFFEKNESRIFAVSGSDGKSTTATIAKLILGTDTVLCGNIGVPTCKFINNKGKTVIELSSFQLNYFSPPVYSAVLTSISENHIDFHGDFESYVQAKENLLKNAKRTAIWLDSAFERNLAKKYLPKTVISYESPLKKITAYYDAESYITVENGIIMLNGAALADAKPLYKYGEYTVKNLMSAIGLTLFQGGDIERAIRDFTPLDERCTLVKDEGGIKYYSSSIDSSPMRTAATLSKFSSDVILILGGRGKNLDIAPLKDAVSGKVKAIFFYGESGSLMLDNLKGDQRLSKIELCYTADFTECVRLAKSYAKSGDSVLLSPAATSYDLFENYKERGKKYKEIINKD